MAAGVKRLNTGMSERTAEEAPSPGSRRPMSEVVLVLLEGAAAGGWEGGGGGRVPSVSPCKLMGAACTRPPPPPQPGCCTHQAAHEARWAAGLASSPRHSPRCLRLHARGSQARRPPPRPLPTQARALVSRAAGCLPSHKPHQLARPAAHGVALPPAPAAAAARPPVQAAAAAAARRNLSWERRPQAAAAAAVAAAAAACLRGTTCCSGAWGSACRCTPCCRGRGTGGGGGHGRGEPAGERRWQRVAGCP